MPSPKTKMPATSAINTAANSNISPGRARNRDQQLNRIRAAAAGTSPADFEQQTESNHPAQHKYEGCDRPRIQNIHVRDRQRTDHRSDAQHGEDQRNGQREIARPHRGCRADAVIQ